MIKPINKTMDRKDLENNPIVDELNKFVMDLNKQGLYTTSWYGTLPNGIKGIEDIEGVGNLCKTENYKPFFGSDDKRIPWYLYWEIDQVLKNGPKLKGNERLLDAGGTSSLFSIFLSSKNYNVNSIDLVPILKENADIITKERGYNLTSHVMDMTKMNFQDNYFDHAYSICVFEHLDNKKAALREISRCLKPEGVLSLTFDYKNPAPFIGGIGPSIKKRHRLSSQSDLERAFLKGTNFELIGNKEFQDNGKEYLNHPKHKTGYTFGVMFLKNKK